ncbi:MAG: DUF5711 family protein [Oscillospiraceae bacterium]|jgi:hypothetical protein
MPKKSPDSRSSAGVNLPPKKKKRRRRRSLLFRAVSFFVMLVVVLGAVALVAFRDQLNIDALRRAIAYRQMERTESGQCMEFQYEKDTSNQFASYQNGLLIASTTGIALLDQCGQVRFSEKAVMSSPIVCTSGNAALVYDAGGPRLVAFSGMKTGLSLTLDNGLSFFSAALNDSGYLTTVSKAPGYKAVVNVYDDTQEHVFRWNSSSHFVSDAAVFNDCKTMAAITVGQSDTQYQSTAVFYRLDSETQYASLDLGSQLVLSVKPMGDLLCVLTEDAVVYINNKGEQVSSYSYQNESLSAFSLDGDGFSVLELGKYHAGSLGRLDTVDLSGNTIATLPFSDHIVSLSVAGRYIGVLFSNHLDIYDKSFNLYARLDDTGNTRKILMRADGSVMCVDADTAWLYLP